MAAVRFERVYKVFGSAMAVEDLSLDVPDGDFLVIVGPSGCGKTTSLRMLAGLERPSYGRIFIDSEPVNNVPAKNRDIAMVFQSYALYPHKTVRGNLDWGMRIRRESKQRIAEQVEEVAQMLGITRLLDKRPASLSGGERQRVALGRALLRDPRVFLMDEPLSNLDAALRVQMRSELIRLHSTLGTTMVYVTHDQIEAMTMGTRIAVMSDGRLQQVAPPETLYDDPVNLFVATFIGSPKMNIFDGQLSSNRSAPTIDFLGAQAPVDLRSHELVGPGDAGAKLVGVRPEDIHWNRDGTEDVRGPVVDGQVEVIEPMGSESYVTLACGDQTLVARFPARCALTRGDSVRLTIDCRQIHLFEASTGEAVLRRNSADRITAEVGSGVIDG